MSALLQVIILGIVEGFTEFLPISSTGHLLLCQHWMGIDLEAEGSFWKSFTIFIQIGAIAAVVVYFRERILELIRGPGRTLKQMTPLEIAGAMRAAQARVVLQESAKRRAAEARQADKETRRQGDKEMGNVEGDTGGHAELGTQAASHVADEGEAAEGEEIVGFVPTAGLGDKPTERLALEYEAAVETSGKDGDAAATSAAVGALATPQERLQAILMILLATVPVLVVGYLVHDWVERYLERPWVIALALLVGGVAMLVIELFPVVKVRTARIEAVTWKQALIIGAAQVLAAVFPGTSRSAATILGGLCAGLSRPAAAEFSFFLAIPSMTAACGYSLLKYLRTAKADVHEILLLVIGTLVSFLVAWGVIAAFMSYIRRHTFVPFAVYRIVLGGIVLWLSWGTWR